ncbi:MAG: response regulator transcription factor [Verrucomicrobiota bacterium]|nr:response regulator transcription factor [Verrucomicrobiota bacterium]
MKAAPKPPAPAKARRVKRRVFVIEDHALMRRSIVGAIQREPDFTVCGEAEDAPEALPAILSLQPDLVLTDIRLKSSSGLDLIKALRERHPEIPIIATTMFDARQTERLARAAGASAFVAKQDGAEQLVAIVRQTLDAAKDQGDRPELRGAP